MTQSSAALKAPTETQAVRQGAEIRTIEITGANRGFGPNGSLGKNVTLSFNGNPRTAHIAVAILTAAGVDIDELSGRKMEVEMSCGKTGLYQIDRIVQPELR